MGMDLIGPPSTMSGFDSARAHLRGVAVVYAALLVHFSLYPYAGWHNPGAAAWDYWIGPSILPVLRFYPLDATFNFLAYVPLGALALCSQPRTWRRYAWAGAVAWLTCTVLSLGLELTQVFLPSRISSKVDLLCNSLGAAVGVLLVRGADCLPPRVRAACALAVKGFLDGVDWEATLTLSLWLFCLLSPLRVPFIMGPWLSDIAAFCFARGFGDGRDPLVAGSEPSRVVVQGIGSLSGLAGVLLLGLSQIKPSSRRLPVFCLLLLVVGLGSWLLPQVQSLAIGLPLLSPLKLWGAVGAASAATATVLGACVARSDWPRRRIAQLSLVALCVAVSCTAALPGASHLGVRPQSPPTQRIITYVVTAAEPLGAIWSVLGLLAAWRLRTKPS